jgi:hypothetical protein
MQLKGAMNVNRLIGLIVVALVLGVLIGVIADYTIGINSSDSNVTGVTYTLLTLVPLALVLTVVIAYFKVLGK